MNHLPANLLEILNWSRAFLLYWYLANENNPDWFGVETRDDDRAIFRWNFRIQPYYAIVASLRTTARRAEKRQQISFIPFCCHLWHYESRWAALRIGGGDTDPKLVQTRAAEAFSSLQRRVPRMGTILEEVGDNQWQVWAIASGFRSWSEWSTLLASVVTDANLNGAGVGYSEFPSPAALLTPRSLGLRAPGAWNPVEERLATIHCHNLHRFLPLIIRRYEGAIAKRARI